MFLQNKLFRGYKLVQPWIRQKEDNYFSPFETLNHQGYMINHLHRISKSFVEFAPHASGPVLDIGTTYGFLALEALKTGAYVIANDMDPRHLDVLHKNIPKEYKSKISFAAGFIPGEVGFKDNSLGAVSASGVLHYLPPSDFNIAIKNISSWLKPRGKFFFSTPSPYTNLYKNFLPTFQERTRLDKNYPGYIKDISKFLPQFLNKIPQSIHLMDKKYISENLQNNGFKIEEIYFFDINLPTLKLIEETNILGVIASKD